MLKKLDKAWGICCNCIIWGIYILAACMLVMAVYYRVRGAGGTKEADLASNYFGGFLVFAAAGGSVTLLETVLCMVSQRENRFDPREMILPLTGTITLEKALHWIAIQTGLIAWDTVFGLLLGILLLMMVCLGGNIPRILLICFVLCLFLVGGHCFWSGRWKKRSFAGKMIHNTRSFMQIEDPAEYAAEVEKSLMNGVLYYGKEFILTKDYMIGLIESDIRFVPVSVPRKDIASLVFFCRKPVMNRYRRYAQGILACRLYSGKSVELMIGQGPRMNRALKVLDYYEIPWKEEETVYE